MLDIGTIWKPYSPLASSVILVWKKDGSLRFYVNLRKLNSQINKDAYSSPWIDMTLSLQGSQWLSSLYLKSGYWQVQMDKESKPLTTFKVGLLGFSEYERMPFRLTNASMTFQWLIETCLGDLDMDWCIIYLEDIIIYSKDPASHLMRLDIVLQKLENARLKLNPSKCELFCKQITYLGHIVSTKGIATDIMKTKVIEKWPIHTTITKARSSLGSTGYYSQFIPKFVQIAYPLWKLTAEKNVSKKKASISWVDRCQWSFDELKHPCTTLPVLGYTDFEKPCKLHTNAWGSMMGTTFYQVSRWWDGCHDLLYQPKPDQSWHTTQLKSWEFLILKWTCMSLPLRYTLTTAPLLHSDNSKAGHHESMMGSQSDQLHLPVTL